MNVFRRIRVIRAQIPHKSKEQLFDKQKNYE